MHFEGGDNDICGYFESAFWRKRPMVSVQAVHATERMWGQLLRWRGHEEEQAWCKKDSIWDMVRLKMLSKNSG